MNGGDQLARGAKSAQYPASEGNVSQEVWDAAFADFVPEKSYLVERNEQFTFDLKAIQQHIRHS